MSRPKDVGPTSKMYQYTRVGWMGILPRAVPEVLKPGGGLRLQRRGLQGVHAPLAFQVPHFLGGDLGKHRGAHDDGAGGQGLTLIHLSAQLKRILWDRGAFRDC